MRHLRSTLMILGLLALVACGGGSSDPCLVLGPVGPPSVSDPPKQVLVDVKFVEVDTTFAADQGLLFPFSAQLLGVDPAYIGSRHRGDEAVVVEDDLLGGAEGTELVVPGRSPGGRVAPLFRPQGLLPVEVENVLALPGLPGPGCVDFTELAGTFQGDTLVPFSLALPDLPGVLENDLAFNVLDDIVVATLVDAIVANANNVLVEAPRMTLYDRQLGVTMVRDIRVMPTDLVDRFRLAVTEFDNTIEWVDTGITLSVTPVVDSGDFIQLDLRPQVSSLSLETGPIVSNGVDDGTIELPAIEFAQARTSVFLDSGQTVVLGGVRLFGNNPVIPGVPLLDRIPVLGPLFTYNSQFDESRTLLIMIRAELVTPP